MIFISWKCIDHKVTCFSSIADFDQILYGHQNFYKITRSVYCIVYKVTRFLSRFWLAFVKY